MGFGVPLYARGIIYKHIAIGEGHEYLGFIGSDLYWLCCLHCFICSSYFLRERVMDYEKEWTEKAKALLLHKRIVNVRYLSKEEAEDMGWDSRGVAFQTNDGNWFFPSRDDEGNDCGALFTSDEKVGCLPVLGGWA